jgi:hypothetical protein
MMNGLLSFIIILTLLYLLYKYSIQLDTILKKISSVERKNDLFYKKFISFIENE